MDRSDHLRYPKGPVSWTQTGQALKSHPSPSLGPSVSCLSLISCSFLFAMKETCWCLMLSKEGAECGHHTSRTFLETLELWDLCGPTESSPCPLLPRQLVLGSAILTVEHIVLSILPQEAMLFIFLLVPKYVHSEHDALGTQLRTPLKPLQRQPFC